MNSRFGVLVAAVSVAMIGCSGREDAPVAPFHLASGNGAAIRIGSCVGIPGNIQAISLQPNAVVSKPNTTGRLTVVDDKGRTIPSCAFKWSTSSSVASVSEGVVTTSAGVGSATIVATYLGAVGITASANLEVQTNPSVSTYTISPSDPQLLVAGQQIQYSAESRDASNRIVWGYPVTWRPQNPSLGNVTISGDGLLTAVIGGGGGTAWIVGETAQSWGKTKVSVNPGSPQVLCWDAINGGWAVYGDCTQAPTPPPLGVPLLPVSSVLTLRFRVVDALNVDIPTASMTYVIRENTGTVTPDILLAPNFSNEFRVTWTLSATPGRNTIGARTDFQGIGISVRGQ